MLSRGGDQQFSKWLDVLFSLKKGSDERGSIGQYWHGNEPSHHLAYLYDYVGESWKTQRLVRQILTTLYHDNPEGLAGNEDCGQMSGWYIMSAMGFYAVAPGQKIYAIGTPLFQKATINLENGKKFVVRANHNPEANLYIQSATLNGKKYSNSYLRHEDIMNGSELVFEMGPKPNKHWGNGLKERPYSENGEPVTRVPYIKSGETLFGESTEIALACDTKDAVIHYTLDGSEPDGKSAIYSLPFTVSNSCVLKMKSFGPNIMASITISYDFRKAVLSEPLGNLKVKQGLAYDYFERFFVNANDMDDCTPVSTGFINQFTIKNATRTTYYGYRYSGYIRVPKDGIYNFSLISNDGSKLYIDGAELIENDANHGAVEEPGSVALKTGMHKIMVKYFQCGGGKALKVSWAGPNMAMHEINEHELFFDEPK